MDILTLKLSSGEELIGQLINRTETVVILKEIKVVIPSTEVDGSLSIRTFPWILTNMTGTHEIGNNFIITQCTTDEKIAQQYIKETSGLILFK